MAETPEETPEETQTLPEDAPEETPTETQTLPTFDTLEERGGVRTSSGEKMSYDPEDLPEPEPVEGGDQPDPAVEAMDEAVAQVQADLEATEPDRTPNGDSPPATEDPATGDSTTGPEKPAGNASRDDWVAYAKAMGATDEDLEGYSRDEIRDDYPDE
jgi:hypothetical protein